MKILEQANYYMNILIFATVLIVAIFAALLYYFVKKRKILAAEEKINYNTFNRQSTMDYLKFDDIVSDDGEVAMGGAGMFVIDDTTFVTGIDVVGYNFHHASAGEQQRTMIGAIAFANIIEMPITLRQTVEAVDIQYNIDQFKEARTKVANELVDVKEAYQDMVLRAEANQSNPEVLEVVLKNLEGLERRMTSLEWKLKEADQIIRYEKLLQERSSNKEKQNQVLFSYHYNPDEFSEELTPEEIKIKAMINLRTKMDIYMDALSNCGCSCRPLTAEKLCSLVRRHLHPVTADLVNTEDRLDIELESLFVTSDSLFELEIEKMGEESYLAMLEMEEAARKSAIEEAQEKREAETKKMIDLAADFGRQVIASAGGM